jgi:cobalt/nickel transport system permease protein
MTIPKWLKEVRTSSCPCCTVSRVNKNRKNFVERTLNGITSLLEDALFSEKHAKRKGFLQTLDPRVKLVTFLLLVVSVSLLKSTVVILLVYLLTLSLAYFSQIGIRFFIKRVWIFIPLFSGIIAFPAMFSFITPGEPLFTLFQFRNSEVAITLPGIKGAVLFVARVATSVSLIVLLTLTTKWNDLLKAMSVLRVPQIFVLVLGMTYRYIFLLLKIAQEMHLTKKSRTINNLSTRREQNWVASRIGGLLRKSYKLSEDVHLAMLSRGFRGEVKTLERFNTGKIDYLWAGFSVISSIIIFGSAYYWVI